MGGIKRSIITARFGLTLLVLFSVLIVCRAASVSAKKKSIYVSLIALLANSPQYEGQTVQVRGFVCVDFESEALYLHEEDYRQGLTKNALALHLSHDQRSSFRHLNLKYVVLQGRFFGSRHDASDENSGAIDRITLMEEWKPALPSPLAK